MASKFSSENGIGGSHRGGRHAGLNNPYDRSPKSARLAAAVGHCLRSRWVASRAEPLPENLAVLVRRLEELDSNEEREEAQ
ncbi:MAG TPA: hypothetical protein VEZ16_09445 [Microvirga sp.]|nr:hypothetical protein [Microvirga sp.]